MKYFGIIFAALVLLAAGCSRAAVSPLPVGTVPPGEVMCTQEAKLCADGSYVGRTGPHCEFAPCPGEQSLATSGIEGVVTIGPSCPVLRDPPEAECQDKPYSAEISVRAQDGSREVVRTSSGADGKFKANLPPGRYVLVPVSGKVYPRASTQEVVVEQGKLTRVEVQFDSGIR